MFGKLLEKLQSWGGDETPIDPSQFGDPVAMQIDWTPAKSGGSNFQTHKLVEVNRNRLEFRTSTGNKMFCLVFLLMGLAVLIGFSAANIASGEFSLSMETIMPMLLGLVFAVAGGSMFYFSATPTVFDKRQGAFWKGRKGPDEVFDRDRLKVYAQLDDVHALQLISEYVRSNKSSYYSYELNLVLGNGERINVVDHGNVNKLREDAGTLSTFLGKPVWDAA